MPKNTKSTTKLSYIKELPTIIKRQPRDKNNKNRKYKRDWFWQKSKSFDLDIIPNKPSLLVAPNGFGKSSFATAFKSLNSERLKLDKKDFYKEIETNLPSLKLKFKLQDQTIIDLEADSANNTISSVFDYYVINSPIKAKGVGQQFGGRTNVSASLTIDDIVLIDRIPENISLGYSYSATKNSFGNSHKILLNLNNIFNCLTLFIELDTNENLTILDRINNLGVQSRINEFKERLNGNSPILTRAALVDWIRNNELQFLKETSYLSNLAEIIKRFDIPFPQDKEIDSFIYAISLSEIYLNERNIFKSFCKRKEYEQLKNDYAILFEELNTTWVTFRPKETEGKLILDFPKAHLISNGQRDVLCFMANLEKAKHKLKKQNCILIIDEVFDYLDDANLVAVQYYTSQFIEEFKTTNRSIYPLLLTHLDPEYFKGHVFGKKHKLKVYYLLKSEALVSEHLIKVLKERNKSTSIVKDDIEKLLLHYHIDKINRRANFQALGLKPTWGEGNNFQNYIQTEIEKYLKDEIEFDPLAVCCGVRVRIEKNIYDLITDVSHKDAFLNHYTSGTNDKLEFAESIGIPVNESYYFLGILYNEALHWKDNKDENGNIAPAMGKLKNMTLRRLVKMVFK